MTDPKLTYSHYIVLCPTGSSKDFEPQLTRSGLSWKEFTLVTMDLPGYGYVSWLSALQSSYKPIGDTVSHVPRLYSLCFLSFAFHAIRYVIALLLANSKSTPHKREFLLESFERDADLAAKLMRHLNYKTYSVLGWSDGAKVASLIAIKHPSRVDNLIIWGFTAHMDKKSCQAIGKTRDVETWEPSMLKIYQDCYGVEQFTDLWHRYVDFVVWTLEFEERFDIRHRLNTIKCPTLIVHGQNDPLVDYNDHIKPLDFQIYDSNIKTFPRASHNLHQAYPKQFNELVSQFIISSRA